MAKLKAPAGTRLTTADQAEFTVSATAGDGGTVIGYVHLRVLRWHPRWWAARLRSLRG